MRSLSASALVVWVWFTPVGIESCKATLLRPRFFLTKLPLTKLPPLDLKTRFLPHMTSRIRTLFEHMNSYEMVT